MAYASIRFDGIAGGEHDIAVKDGAGLTEALLNLQRRQDGVNFLVDVEAPGRERISAILAGDRGQMIVWSKTGMRAVGDGAETGEVYVWDGSGIDVPTRNFVPLAAALAAILAAVVEWVDSGTLSREVEWTSEPLTSSAPRPPLA